MVGAGSLASPENTLGLDYAAEAVRLGPPPVPIIDAHAHVHGAGAARVYDRARRAYGVEMTYSMTQAHAAGAVRDALGDSVRFIAIPSFSGPDASRAHRHGYLESIERLHRDFGCRMLKIWASPRLRDIVPDGATDLWEIDSRWRREACSLGRSLGMIFMVHVADPDTWFTAKYADAGRYGTKRDQYVGLERMLDDYPSPWVAAHLGGWPEDLAFLDGLMARHPNLHLDTSATKWMVRELGRHDPGAVAAFFGRHRRRLLFGSDIVTMDDHLSPSKQNPASTKSDQSSTPEGAFELYASRYWALRTMFETAHDGPSPIADGDLKMVDPSRHDDRSSPRLRGLRLDPGLLADLYRGNAMAILDRWWKDHA